MLLYRGEAPSPFDPSLDTPGQPTYPRRYGYAWVGEVVMGIDDGTGSIASVPSGTRIFSLAPHADYHVFDPLQVATLPPEIPAERAVLCANLETAVTCIWDAQISLGDRVIVLGGGIVGLLTAWLAQLSGTSIILIEPAPRRRAAALALGITSTCTPEEALPSGTADGVIEATGNPTVLDQAIQHAGQEARVVIASFYGARTAPVSLGTAFHRRRLALVASQVSRLPPSKLPRWTAARRFELVRQLLRRAELDGLIDPPISFDEAATAYARLDQAETTCLQTVFRY